VSAEYTAAVTDDAVTDDAVTDAAVTDAAVVSVEHITADYCHLSCFSLLLSQLARIISRF
jgi:hypothetical protein